MKLYPHDTRLKQNVTIQQKRYLPRQLRGSVVANKGQEVSPVSVVARADMDQGYYVLDGREALRVKADDVAQYVTVGVGVQIRRTAPILEKTKRIGRNEVVESPVEGVLEEIIDGRLLIRRTPRELLVRSMLSGWIIDVTPGRGVEVESTGSQIEVAWGCGKEGYGELKLLSELPDEETTKDEIASKAQASILAIGYLRDVELIQHAIDQGARGLILGSTTTEIFRQATMFEIPVYITEGVQMRSMSSPVFDLLQQNEGKTASLLSSEYSKTRRPEILITSQKKTGGLPVDAFSDIEIGQHVRLLRPPYSGQIGTIATIYPHARRSEVGYLTAGADVKLSSGEVVFVPDSNLDIIM